ncbi:MAG: TIGR02757 family protein [Bacteroidales bacterium]|nr:TIGR02757 family protein [Bacteroidales bacterium]
MKRKELYQLLEEQYLYFNQKYFIETDPIQVPHYFSKEEDIEIAGFIAASLAWGQRPVIIRNAFYILEDMPGGPFEFLTTAEDYMLQGFENFKHRTFNGTDCVFFLRSLQNIYRNHGGLKNVFYDGYKLYGNIPDTLRHFRQVFFSIPFPGRTLKHIADIDRKSAAKRLNMFLRWMVRKDENGVDFGIWNEIPTSALYIPLDVHSGSVARELGLLKRKQNDWKSVSYLTHKLREFDPDDPVKYDFALFGIGAIGRKE